MSRLDRFRHPQIDSETLKKIGFLSRIRRDFFTELTGFDSELTGFDSDLTGCYASEEHEGQYEPVGMLRTSLRAVTDPWITEIFPPPFLMGS